MIGAGLENFLKLHWNTLGRPYGRTEPAQEYAVSQAQRGPSPFTSTVNPAPTTPSLMCRGLTIRRSPPATVGYCRSGLASPLYFHAPKPTLQRRWLRACSAAVATEKRNDSHMIAELGAFNFTVAITQTRGVTRDGTSALDAEGIREGAAVSCARIGTCRQDVWLRA